MVPVPRCSGNRHQIERGCRSARITCVRIRRSASVCVIVLLGLSVGCTAASPSQTPAPSPSPAPSAADTGPPEPSRTLDPVATDLDRLLRALDSTHPEPFHSISRDDFAAALSDYAEALPDLTPDEAVVELMRTVALLSREGRDGHQFALPMPGHEGPVLPLRIYEFAEGVFITAAAPPHESLVAASITAIDGTPIDEVLAAVEPLVPRDGPATVPAFRPIFLLRTEVLRGLGIIGDGPVELSIDHHGLASTVMVEPMAFDANVDWGGGMHFLPIDERVRYLAAATPLNTELIGDALYLRYRPVSSPDVTEARDIFASGEAQRLILDLRQNPGGDNGTYGRVLRLAQEFAAENPGALYVLIDRVTFSAASNLATEIEQSTDATFIGEPMGGGLNFWNDVRQVRLEALPVPMQVGVSTRYWQFAEPDDPRLTIEPDVVLPVTADDHFARRDPVLDAVLAAGR